MARDWPAYWERLWETGQEDKLGPKGEAYIRDKYGETYEYQEPYDYDDYGDYDFDIEY